MLILFPCATAATAAEPARPPSSGVVVQGETVTLRSPSFEFVLATAEELRAVSWKNRLTQHALALGNGTEVEFDLGLPGETLVTPKLTLKSKPTKTADDCREAVFELASADRAVTATVIYRWNDREPVLHKFVKIANAGNQERRLLNVRQGTYPTDAKLSDREQGFPVYLNDEFFMSLAHPAGWATAKEGAVSLRQYPGAKLAPGAAFECMEAVYGVGKTGEARQNFVAHVKSRMRRVVRGHDKPYAIYDNFGSWPAGAGGDWRNAEVYELHSLELYAKSQKATGCRFDLWSIDFWVDPTGDLKRWDPARFPQGIANITPTLDSLGTAPGLWIDSSNTWSGMWGIGQNPAAQPSISHDPGWFCRASEPIKSMYREAFLHHIREEGVRMLKFDNLHTVCNNPHHDHLPGLYSTEAIENSVIEFLHDLDQECPEVLLILYWGYRSPWWLLHGDTLFDSGIGIEAASPSSQPAPYARDSVTQKLDQAQRHSCDVPALGKDSLGIWLSNWKWNSSIGKEHWQKGFVMDMCRGSLLAQIWADNDWLSPPEWQQLADFIALMRAQPGCFGNPRFILGNPMNNEPYGYCCTDGRRAFLALDNCTWQDRSLPLELNADWGLFEGQRWDLYRWYPEPAKLKGNAESFGSKTSILLKPFEVALLEVVPAGQKPTLDRSFTVQPIPAVFAEPSREVKLNIRDANEVEKNNAPIWTVLEPTSAVSKGGATLTKQADGSIVASGKNPAPDTYTIKADTKLTGITGLCLEVLADPQLPSQGPGRAYNGNFVLNEFAVTASPFGSKGLPESVSLHKPAASFSQSSYGNWPIEAAIDNDPKTAWSIDPYEGMTHTAIFEIREPPDFTGGSTLTFTLDQGYPSGLAEHTIGRFRLSATTAKPPFLAPAMKGTRRFVIQAQLPAAVHGGIFVVAADLKKGSEAISLADIGVNFSGEAKLAGQPVVCQPVLGKGTYPSSWQGWRIALEPSAELQGVELSISTTLPRNVQCKFKGHFIPSK